MNLLVFNVGGERYALRAAAVREVVRAVAITPLPQAPEIVEGIINLRGVNVPVLNLRRRLGAPPTPLSAGEHFVVAEAGGRLVVFRADPGTEMVGVGDECVQEIDDVVRGTSQVSGVARLSGDIVLVHDIAAFLSAAESDALDGALGGHSRTTAAA